MLEPKAKLVSVHWTDLFCPNYAYTLKRKASMEGAHDPGLA
jgi:hypothetical protein